MNEGLGECGCCGGSWDGKERFAACFAVWGGRLLQRTATYRTLLMTITWTHVLQKRWRNASGVDELYPGETNTWTWTNTSTQSCNKWTGVWGDLSSATLTSGELPPASDWDPYIPDGQIEGWIYDSPADSVPWSDWNPYLWDPSSPFPTVVIPPAGWMSSYLTVFNTYHSSTRRLLYGPWWYNDGVLYPGYPVGWVLGLEGLTPIPNEVPYYTQTLTATQTYAIAAPDIYTRSEYDANWASLYARLSPSELVALKEADDDFHWQTFQHDATGAVVERRYYERTDIQAGATWADSWIDVDGVWSHKCGLYDSTGRLIFIGDTMRYIERTGAGSWSSAVLCPGMLGLVATENVDDYYTAPEPGSVLELPQSTYSHLQFYRAPTDEYGARAGIDGVPDIVSVRFAFDTWVNPGHSTTPDSPASVARVTVVPLDPTERQFALRRYWFAAGNSDGVNPVGCCRTVENTGDDAIAVQNPSVAFEFVRTEACGAGETTCSVL